MTGNSINSVNQMVCPTSGDDDDRARLYVAGQLSADEAEEFEHHFFECDACAADVERAMEIRAALAKKRVVAGGRWRVGLAMAATVAAIALGLWQLQLRETPLGPPPLRGGSGREISASGRRSGTTFNASWNAVKDARSYRVQIFNAIGEPLMWNETTNTRLTVDLGQLRKGDERFWKVQALDEEHRVIASSAVMKIPGP